MKLPELRIIPLILTSHFAFHLQNVTTHALCEEFFFFFNKKQYKSNACSLKILKLLNSTKKKVIRVTLIFTFLKIYLELLKYRY